MCAVSQGGSLTRAGRLQSHGEESQHAHGHTPPQLHATRCTASLAIAQLIGLSPHTLNRSGPHSGAAQHLHDGALYWLSVALVPCQYTINE